MSIKLTFEIGHSASRKTKPSKEGFTHDWELFVRGPNQSDIAQFVDKVVFNLHESFPKPKRAFKEPPYVVKEAGYAGFLLTIDINLKNRDEPKKVTFEYDLDLQPYKTQVNEFIIATPSDDFKRKCLKGGGVLINTSSDFKSRDPYGKVPQMPSMNEAKKSSKRPEENKPNKQFTDLFGAVLKKPDPRSLQTSSPNPTKLPSSGKGVEKPSSSSVSGGGKDKGEKVKHKHSPNKDGKDVKKSSEGKQESEKPKKDKTKDRERSDKKEKVSKRPSSPSPSSMPGSSSSSSARISTNLSSLPLSKNDLVKPPSKQSSTPVPSNDSSFNKKSSKKDKKSDKERERSDKKESRAKDAIASKDKAMFEAIANKSSNAGMKDREPIPGKDERDKNKQAKLNSSAAAEPKTTPMDSIKKHDKDSERKHKHKKKEKTKDKDGSKESNKKEKPHKNSVTTVSPAKSKDPIMMKYDHLSDNDSSDSDVDSPPSIKQYSDNSMSEAIMQKPPPEIEKPQKKSRDRTKTAEKDEKNRKSRKSKKEDRDSSASPPPSKQSRKDISKSPLMQDRPSSSDSAAHHSHTNNNNVEGAGKISNEYMSELKDLKQKITTLKNNDDLQNVVRLIAATGCYEITKSSFDFDLVQLDRVTVQRLQEFFAAS